MFLYGGIGVLLLFPWVCGQAFQFMEYLDQTIGVDDLDALSYMLVGYTIVVFVLAEVDMAVFVYRSFGV